MFEPLFARLSDRYHLVAPDYPGFGHSDWPDPKAFPYTFDHIAEIMNNFTEALGLSHYTLSCRITAGPLVSAWRSRTRSVYKPSSSRTPWRTTKAWGRIGRRDGRFGPIALPTKARFAQICCRSRQLAPAMPETIPTSNATILICGQMNFIFSTSPARLSSRTNLFYDYRTNVENHSKWQAWMHEKQQRLLVIWGKYELSFDPSEPEAYRRDVPNAQVQIVDGGHFALDTAADEIAALVGEFMKTQK